MRRIFISILFTSSIHLCGQEVLYDSLDLKQVFIKASRSSNVDPLSFQTIQSAQIEKVYSGQDPSVLLQQLSPSIVSYSDAGTDIGNYAQFRMRGISQSRINVTLNGVPLNDMIDQGVFFSNFSDFGNSVESVQVQRGVGASGIGVASYGGSVNFESVNVFTTTAGSNLELTTGSFGTLRTSAEINTGKLSNGVGAYGRITRTSVNGYKEHSASDSYSIFGSIGHAGNQHVVKLTGFMGKTQNDQSYLPVLLDDINVNPKTNYNHPNDTDDFEQELIQLQYSNSLNSNTSIDATLYYGGARGVFPFATDDETQCVFGLTNDHYGIMSHLNIENENITIRGGIQAYQFDRTNFEYLAPNVSNPIDRDHSGKTEISTFAKVNYDIDRVSLFGNVQLRNVDLSLRPDPELATGINFDKNWFFLNWIFGLNYQLNDVHSFYASYGRTSREPTRSDIRNGAVLEENVNDMELGWRISNENLTLSANVFHMNFTNEISQVGALMERSYMDIRQNVPRSKRSGIELQMGYQVAESTSFTFNASYLTTNVDEFNTGDQTLTDVRHIFAPKWIFRPQFQFDLVNDLEIILSGRYVSTSFMELANLPGFELPAHAVVNTQVNWKLTERFSCSLMLNNLPDEQYFTDGAPVDLDFDGLVEGPGYRIQPPRHFYAVFRVHL